MADGANQRVTIEFEQWRAIADHASVYDRLLERQEDLRALGEAQEILSLRQQTLARLATKRPKRAKAPAIAALTLSVLIVGIPIYVLQQSGNSSPAGLSQSELAEGQIYSTVTGQRMTLTLGDGSRVMLNTASRLRVAYSDRERKLILEEGQAWFEVAKHRQRPFRVFANGQMVEAHGTAFDVRINQNRTEVMLAEGKVTVQPQRHDNAGARVAMNPRELLVASAAGTSLRAVDDPEAWKNWREGIVTFKNTPLSEAIAEMNRYSEQQLAVADTNTGRIIVSGAFHAGSTQAFVEALAIGFHIQGNPQGNGLIILRQMP